MGSYCSCGKWVGTTEPHDCPSPPPTYHQLREALVGLIENVRAHRYGRCPGLVAADCLEAIYEATEIAAAVLPMPFGEGPSDSGSDHAAGSGSSSSSGV